MTYAKAFKDELHRADVATTLLVDIRQAAETRNRLVHDLHDIDVVEGHITRRRLWEKQGGPIDLASYRQLARSLAIMAGPAIDPLAECLQPRSTMDQDDVGPQPNQAGYPVDEAG